jgi:hypothetical protein
MDNLPPIPNNEDLEQAKQQVFEDIQYRLGKDIVDLEIDPTHLEAAYRYAVKTYRQRAQNATIESYTLLTTQKNVFEYTLPSEFINVRALFRRTIGMETGGGGTAFDPFSSAILNTYLLNYNSAGGLATYHFYASYVELAARMFGGYLTYTFNPVTKQIKITRNFRGTGERILVWADIHRTELELLLDPSIGVWIADFIMAELKEIIGQAREKYGTIAGPGGGTSLNGSAMKAEGKADKERLLQDLRNYQDGSMPLTWVQG